MKYLRRHRQLETWEEMRERLMAETSTWLSDHLDHPELAVSIPSVPAGKAEFPPSLASAFWRSILFQ